MRNFSDDERRKIREELVETARELIIRHGFKKTTVEDITEPVGIAEGTFYRFFDSKSDIYLEVILREHEALLDIVESELADIEDPKRGLERFLYVWIEGFEERPILLRSHQTFSNYPLRSVEPEMYEEVKQKYADRLEPIIEDFQARSDGLIHDLNTHVIMEVLSTIELVARHQDVYEKYGWNDYLTVRDTMIKVMVEGLINTE